MRTQNPKTRDIKFIIKNGIKETNSCFSLFLTVPVGTKEHLFTANVAKKSVKQSVDRNKYKRWMRAAYHKQKALLKGYNVLIMPRRGMSGLLTFAQINESLSELIEKALKRMVK